MSAPTIPPDVENAIALLSAACFDGTKTIKYMLSLGDLRLAISTAIAAAVEREREACAKVCVDRALLNDWERNFEPTEAAIGRATCMADAEAIRARSAP